LVWRIIRQRVVDQVASVLDIDYLDKELVPTMTREIAEHSIYHFIENDLGLSIDYAKKEITIDHATSRDKILLDIERENHVVSVKSQVYLANGQQFQFTDSRHKLDKFRFVDCAKRHKKKKEREVITSRLFQIYLFNLGDLDEKIFLKCFICYFCFCFLLLMFLEWGKVKRLGSYDYLLSLDCPLFF